MYKSVTNDFDISGIDAELHCKGMDTLFLFSVGAPSMPL